MRAHSPDYPLIGGLFVLLSLGTLILVSVSAVLSQEQFGYSSYFWFHQIIYGFLPGLFLGFLSFLIPLSFLRKWAFVLFIINLVILGLVFVPKVGLQTGGASRWINLGPISFQPAEFLKISFILYLAAWLSNLTKSSTDKRKRLERENITLVA